MKEDKAKRSRNSRIRDFFRWKLELKKIRKFSLNYFFSFFGNRDYVRFIILTRSRTGSNLLVDYLNSHGQIFTRSEIFRRLHGRKYQSVLRRVYRKQPRFIKAVGFKIFYRHPLDTPHSGLWEFLEQDRAIRVIHLTRDNILRSVVSHRIADKIDVLFQKKKPKRPGMGAAEKKVHLDFDGLLEEFSQTIHWQLDGEARFRGHPVLKISYEELVRNPVTAFAGVCDFLGVTYRKPTSTFMKQNPEPLQDLLGNYAELREKFRGTKWEAFFEEL
jgi:LPS sulfotransferase NodH